MYALFLSILITAAAVTASVTFDLHISWTIIFGFLGFFGSNLLISLLMRKKLTGVQNELQEMMTAAQGKMNRKIQQQQNRGGANPAALKKQMEVQQAEVMKQALEHTVNFEPFKKWNLTMGRQISTMRLQYLYHLKRWQEVDDILAIKKLLSKPLMMEPTMVAIKMARRYEKGDLAAAEKVFKKHVRFMRGSRGSLLYGTLSWMLVKQGKLDEARSLLAEGKEKTKNQTLIKNWEHLANDRAKKFSNAGLGEEWYALYLEPQPLPKQQRVRQGRGQGAF